jgi:hypothetical protein
MSLDKRVQDALLGGHYFTAARLDVDLSEAEYYEAQRRGLSMTKRAPRTPREMADEHVRALEREAKQAEHFAMGEVGRERSENDARSRLSSIHYRIQQAKIGIARQDADERRAKDAEAARVATAAREAVRLAPDFRAAVPDEQRLALAQQYAQMKRQDPAAAVGFAQKYQQVLFDPQTTAAYEAWQSGQPAPNESA